MTDQTVQLSPEQELAELESRQRKLKSQIDEKAREKTQKTIEALAEKAKQREAEELEEKRALEELSRRKREREERERQEEEQRSKQAAAERAEREAQLQREKAEREQRNFEQTKLNAARQKEQQLEAQLVKLREEIARGIVVSDVEEPEAPSLSNPAHPLSKLFGTASSGDLSTQEVDTVAKASADAAQTQVLSKASGLTAWRPRRKTQRFVDQTLSGDLERAIRTRFRMSANPMRCDQLSSQWDWVDVMKALDIVEEKFKTNPCGHDALFAFIESTLNDAA